jgi:hypothetical protein
MIKSKETEAKEINVQLQPDLMIELGNENNRRHFLLIHYLSSTLDSLQRCVTHNQDNHIIKINIGSINTKINVGSIILNYIDRYRELSASLGHAFNSLAGVFTASAQYCSKVNTTPTVNEILSNADRFFSVSNSTLSSHIQTIIANCHKFLEENKQFIEEIGNALTSTSSIAALLTEAHYECIKMSQMALKAHYIKWRLFWDWFEKFNQQVIHDEEQCDLASLLLSGNNIKTAWGVIQRLFFGGLFLLPNESDAFSDLETEKQIKSAISKKLNFNFKYEEEIVFQLLLEAEIRNEIKLGNLEQVASRLDSFTKNGPFILTNYHNYMILALLNKQYKIFYFLWDKYQDKKNNIRLLIAAIALECNDVSKFLMPDFQDINQYLPIPNQMLSILSIAVMYNNLAMVIYLLLNKKANPNVGDYNSAPLFIAVKNKNVEIVDHLIRASASFNISIYNIFEYAVLHSSIEVAHFILKKMLKTPSVMSNWIESFINRHKTDSLFLKVRCKSIDGLAEKVFLLLVTCAERDVNDNYLSRALDIYEIGQQLLTSTTIAEKVKKKNQIALGNEIKQVTERLSKYNGNLIKSCAISNITSCTWEEDPLSNQLRLAVTDKVGFNRIKKTLKDMPFINVANSTVTIIDLIRINVQQLMKTLSNANAKAALFKEKHNELPVTRPPKIVLAPISYTLQKPIEHLVTMTEDHSEEKKPEQQPSPSQSTVNISISHFYEKLPVSQFFSKENPSTYNKDITVKANIDGYLIMDYVNSCFGHLENDIKLCIARETLEKKSPETKPFNFELFYPVKKLKDSKVKDDPKKPLQNQPLSKALKVEKSNLNLRSAIQKYKFDDRNVGNDQLVLAQRCHDKLDTISSILARMNMNDDQKLEANILLLKKNAPFLVNDYKNFYQRLEKNISNAEAACQELNLNFKVLSPQLNTLRFQDFHSEFQLHQDIISYALFHNALCLFEAMTHYSGKQHSIARKLRNMIEHVITDHSSTRSVIDFASQVTYLMKSPLSIEKIQQNIQQLQATELFAFFTNHLLERNHHDWPLEFCLNTIRQELVKAFLFTLFLQPTDIGLTDVYQICIDATKYAFTKIGVLYAYMRDRNLLEVFTKYPELEEFLSNCLFVKIKIGHDSGVSCQDEFYTSFDEISPKKVFEMAKDSVIHCLSVQSILTDSISKPSNKLNPLAPEFKP